MGRGGAVTLAALLCACEVPNPAYSEFQVRRGDAAAFAVDGPRFPKPTDAQAGGFGTDAGLPAPWDALRPSPDVTLAVDMAPSPPADVMMLPPPMDTMPPPPDVMMDPPDTRPALPDNLASGLVSYWPLDEEAGNRAEDLISDNHGIVESPQPDSIWRLGYIGNGAALSEVNEDAIEVPPSNSLNSITSEITVAAWVRVANVPDRLLSIISRQRGNGTQEYYDLAIWNNTARFYMYNTAQQTHASLFGNDPVPSGVWTHVAATYDGIRARLYVNGVQDAVFTFPAQLVATNKPLFLGTNINQGTYDRRETFNGTLDEVYLYRRALSATEILQLMNL